MLQLAGGEDCEISIGAGIVSPALLLQVPTPAVLVAGHTQYFNIWLTVNRMGCRTAPFGSVGVPVPITSSALTSSGETGNPAASDVPMSFGVRLSDDAFGQSALEESVHGPS